MVIWSEDIIPSFADRLRCGMRWMGRHPSAITILGVIGAFLLLQAGVIGPLDWWSGGDIPR